MNQLLVRSLTTTLLMASLGGISSGNATQVDTDRQAAHTQSPASEPNQQPPVASAEPTQTSASAPVQSKSQTTEVVKVGEEQTAAKAAVEAPAIARIYAHQVKGREAATLYVRGIPVLTFLGDANRRSPQSESVKIGAEQPAGQATPLAGAATKELAGADAAPKAGMEAATAPASATTAEVSEPVQRATELAAQINRLHRNGIDAETIKARWYKPEDGAAANQETQLVIKVDGEVLTALDEDTMLPDTTRDRQQDALQVANRLRRLLGGAKPLSQISGTPPQAVSRMAYRSVMATRSGMASWYGPGFHGNRSASGEVFNQHAMTAAHRTLPFGTQVRVTNMDNGRSVVVRINDRGPFHGNRIIDLSAGAARVIGLMSAGVAPVQIEVLGN